MSRPAKGGGGHLDEGENMMTILGYIFLALLALTVVGLLVLIVAGVPDLRRYVAMRRM